MAKHLDLARAKAAAARIAARLRADPALAARTATFLAQEPSAQGMEELMSESLDHPTVIRLPKSILDRAEALKRLVAKDRQYQMIGRISRNAVLRLALLRGLESLETEYAGATKRRR